MFILKLILIRKNISILLYHASQCEHIAHIYRAYSSHKLTLSQLLILKRHAPTFSVPIKTQRPCNHVQRYSYRITRMNFCPIFWPCRVTIMSSLSIIYRPAIRRVTKCLLKVANIRTGYTNF